MSDFFNEIDANLHECEELIAEISDWVDFFQGRGDILTNE